ncbi:MULTISPECIES: ABC transporter substrate-binding protein/permease [Streptococcus]|uniref:Amino acid ABC transporter substrate-binding protein n=1 Tax=Streptococcus gordonii TaxID=1302 RepID=A0AAW3H6Y5_STRGN|nr:MULTISPECIES: ABC transporter substrate-binding protein/permease [Streptococcus]KJQ58559.1 amino acid ABC transporter substrate-binding protein [Streptococcus gordonii]MCB6406520.1 ABC transporter substrate-binding protein/permease [Streptococcus gordonii]MDN5020289.1 ABC transporter substrate-binding protein/permease [Streptococcus sp. SG2]RSJ34818.1 L-cystine transport system permease protein TcyB [Streptococcus gordonii]RSJ37360.1 L-cystine transport system permease protein TcyB [Strepto
MKKKLLAVLLTLFPFFALGATAQADTVKIVSDTAYAPFEFKDSDQTYKGIDVDIINKVAEIKGWDIDMSFPGFDAAVNAVQAGQADAIMAGMTKTSEREKVFTMSDTYYDTKVVIATRKENTISKYEQLKGKKVGVKTGTAAQRFLEKNKDKYGYTLKTFDTGDLMYNSLSAGDVDAVMDDQPVIEYAINQGQNLKISMKGEAVGSFAFGVKKGSKHEHLVTEFNEALAQMKEDGSLEEIINKWTASKGSSDSAVPETFTPAGQKATPTKDKYIIASDSSFAPFVFQDDSNQYTGIDMELIKAIAKDQGFTVEVTNPGFDAAINSVQTGQADGIIAGMSVTDARKKTFDYSDPYYTANSILAVKDSSNIKSYEELKGKTVGVKTGTASQTFLEENKSKYGYSIKTFSDAASMYDSLNTGSVAAVMDDEPVVKYAIKQGKKLKTPIEGTPSGQVAFAVKKGSNPELIEMFNKGLANLKESGKYQEILDKYLASEEKESTVDESTIWGLLQNNYKELLKGLGVTIALALISFAIAMVIGIIFGMFSVSPYKPLRWIAEIFVDVIRGIPLMIVAAFIFWGIPNLIESMTGQQSPINAFVAGTIALSLNAGAYIAEIVRGGIQAVPVGQMEASRSLGISYSKTMRKIILPQATKIMLPNFVNQFVIALKDTTIVSAIGLAELFKTGKDIIARNYQSFRMYAILAVLYLIIITLLTRLAKRLEKRIK